ncbi:hypothetical protein NQ176_g2800 [Zarea fungicola]|uniref:Uncharacterized protein n=1 Tax=Zarea fungicola TaxID=93591 RepID=A0ACC1NM67_9HYPO|nr:hypothetical protein NQ176_g2800 [Lecanicillium fungicola]
MKLLAFNILITLAASAAIEPLVSRDYQPCSGLTGTPLCCGTSVDGILELDCAAPSISPESGAAFQANCASVGKSPGCCLLGLAGLALVCNSPTGA